MTNASRRRARQKARLIRIQRLVLLALVLVLAALIVLRQKPETVPAEPPVTSAPITETAVQVTASPAPEPEIILPPYSDEEVEAIALTLSGECYDDMIEDKTKVAEVIVNRVSANGFGSTVLEVVSAPNQFLGYYAQSRAVSDSDIEIAKIVLQAWYDNDCEALSDWLYFSAGENRENIFRTTFN